MSVATFNGISTTFPVGAQYNHGRWFIDCLDMFPNFGQISVGRSLL
jgi:hypothetical protein